MLNADQKQLLENWEKHYIHGGLIRFTKGVAIVLANDVEKLLEAQDSKTRQECAEIVEDMFGWQLPPEHPYIRDPISYGKFLYEKMNKSKQEAQQQILDLNNKKYEN